MTPSPHLIHGHRLDAQAVCAELRDGLSQRPARIAPKFLYDALGSRLFDAICELDEYYPTRTEAAIVAACRDDLARRVPRGAAWFDLGAGNGAKAERLFDLLRPRAYVALDFSSDYLGDALRAMAQRHPSLPLLGLGIDFAARLDLPDAAETWLAGVGGGSVPRVVLYPGSSIGNFAPAEALALLTQAHALCRAGGPGGGLLIGVDRVKARDVLEPAYDDPLGVTAAFNRNLLRHVNRWLGSDFRPGAWRHVAFYNEADSRIEMHLQADGVQCVSHAAGTWRFEDGERIHTENSWKWAPADFTRLLQAAGFGEPVHWTDARGWFSVFWAPA
jgi:dimethylhistidine N-methyltransferase